ncbi:MAG: beta-lactamase family protein, partial [Gemmatimonadetes bacterium]|nr:beta-lactamase family protein [Gemmatimonadota bacterium]
KPITGAAAQILIDQGEMGLNDPVALYLPGFDTDASRGITVRQMLTHRAGLPANILTSRYDYATLADLGNAVGERGPESEPGSRFWYTDSGTDALGALVEAVSGMKLNDFVRDELLEPLGMSESFYFLDDEDPRRGRIATLQNKGADGWETIIDPEDGPYYPFAWGAQSLYSTPLDYAKFLAMWMDGGRAGDRAVLSEEAVARTLRPVSEMTLPLSSARRPTQFSGMEVYYGQMAMLVLPVEADGSEPATIIGHSGADGTMALAWPERDLMVLFFAQQRGVSVTLRVEEAVDRFLIVPEAYADASSDDLRQLAPYPGTYIADWGTHMKEEFTVHVKMGQLWIDMPLQGDLELVPAEEEGRWSLAAAPQIGVWFERDQDGAVDCLRIQEGPLVHEAPRKGTPREMEVDEANRADPEALAPYLGTYDDPGTERNARILIDRDYLALEGGSGNVVHLWKYPLADVWVVREGQGLTLSFQEEEGVVVGFTLERAGVPEASPIFRRIR